MQAYIEQLEVGMEDRGPSSPVRVQLASLGTGSGLDWLFHFRSRLQSGQQFDPSW